MGQRAQVKGRFVGSRPLNSSDLDIIRTAWTDGRITPVVFGLEGPEVTISSTGAVNYGEIRKIFDGTPYQFQPKGSGDAFARTTEGTTRLGREFERAYGKKPELIAELDRFIEDSFLQRNPEYIGLANLAANEDECLRAAEEALERSLMGSTVIPFIYGAREGLTGFIEGKIAEYETLLEGFRTEVRTAYMDWQREGGRRVNHPNKETRTATYNPKAAKRTIIGSTVLEDAEKIKAFVREKGRAKKDDLVAEFGWTRGKFRSRILAAREMGVILHGTKGVAYYTVSE